MMVATEETVTWATTFQALLRHYLPPVQNTPLVNVAGLLAIGLGAFLAFRCWKYEHFVISACGVFIGVWLGYAVAVRLGIASPIPCAIGAVALTGLAYRTYRCWLAAGSVVVLFIAAIVFQLGRGDLQRYLPEIQDQNRPLSGDWISRLPKDAQEMSSNLYTNWAAQVAKLEEPVVRALKELGPMGWLVPVGAALLGGLLAYWALQGFAVVWMGFIGALLMVMGGLVFISAHWPDAQPWIIAQPHYPAGAILGCWLLGLILQAKDARIPKKPPAPEPKESAPKKA